jgi:hypothetical protein
VVVSDNSTDAGEQDRLAAFCGRQPSGAVWYTRPPEPLAMAEHWEWLRQLVEREVAPTHLTYLTDRMVFAAGALDELLQIVEREPDYVLSYQHDTIDDRDASVELIQSQWTGRLLELDARELIGISSRGEFGNYLPRMLNSIAPAATLARIEERFGSVFQPVSPDYRFAYRCLATCATILYLDRSCLVEHGTARSSGIAYMRGRPNEAATRFQRELSKPRFGDTPEPAFEIGANAIWQEYFSVRAEVGDDRFPPVDWGSYLTANAVGAGRIEDPEWRARMKELLRQRGWTRRRSIRHAARLSVSMAGYFLRHPTALPRTLKRLLWDRPPGTPFAFLLPKIGLSPRTRDDLRFESTADAIVQAGARPRPRRPYTWPLYRLSRAGAIVRRVPNGGAD